MASPAFSFCAAVENSVQMLFIEIETADEHQHEKEIPAITPGKPEADSEPETAH